MNAMMYNFNTWIKYREESILVREFERLLVNSGFTIVNKVEHFFEGQGYTGLWLLAESHFAIHSFPEEDKVYIEISSCVKEYFDRFVKEISKFDANFININMKGI